MNKQINGQWFTIEYHETDRHGDAFYHACFDGVTGWGSGKTEDEALRRLYASLEYEKQRLERALDALYDTLLRVKEDK